MERNSNEIIITSDTTVRDVQKEFELFYPFLKIEFSTNDPGVLPKSRKVNPDNIINKISHLLASVKLFVDEERTIAEVKKIAKTC